MSPVLADRRAAERVFSATVTVARRSMSGADLGTVSLDPSYFSVAVNVPLLHQVVTAQLAGRRAGTQSTRTRAEVKGGSAKPFRQKGTGNARQGSIRAPHYSGGGVALGPKPRSYAQRTPRKMIQQALRCSLSDRAAGGRIVLVDRWQFEVPKTRDAAAALSTLGCAGNVLVVLARDEELAARSFANLGHVSTLPADQLSAYDVMLADWVVFSDATLPGGASEPGAASAGGSGGGAELLDDATEDVVDGTAGPEAAAGGNAGVEVAGRDEQGVDDEVEADEEADR